MSEEQATPDEQVEETSESEDRYFAARDRFHALGVTPQISIENYIEVAGAIDALTSLLLDAGIIDEEEFRNRKAEAGAHHFDSAAEAVRAIKREAIVSGALGDILRNPRVH